ncbi:hypothetical protein EI94DRAFT_1762821 [Lactarius quietus]|nr:hypothetical protein EI94DRAFT_1762821 [Lactarius quietus]
MSTLFTGEPSQTFDLSNSHAYTSRGLPSHSRTHSAARNHEPSTFRHLPYPLPSTHQISLIQRPSSVG